MSKIRSKPTNFLFYRLMIDMLNGAWKNLGECKPRPKRTWKPSLNYKPESYTDQRHPSAKKVPVPVEVPPEKLATQVSNPITHQIL